MGVTFQRVLSDDELHRRVGAAFGSGRRVYTRVGSDRDIGRIAARLRSDKNAQAALSAFLDDLVAASGRLKTKPKKRRRVRNMILVSSAASASTALAAASGRFKEKPKKRNRVRTMILVGSALGASTVVVIRRRRSRDNRSVATNAGNAPADFPTQAPAHAE
jgi:hypothetical protein